MEVPKIEVPKVEVPKVEVPSVEIPDAGKIAEAAEAATGMTKWGLRKIAMKLWCKKRCCCCCCG